jgi:CubicO group peptidase (beta-lactamase class C family)
MDDKKIISEKQKELIFDASKHLPNEGQMSFAFIRNGEVSYYGLKRTNDSISSFENSKNVFEIGSISKVFTSNIFASFILQDKVGLDDNINEYLDYDVKDNALISFKSLANHTSGLPRLPNNLKASYSREKTNVYKKEDLDIYIKDSLEINIKTKGKFVYSNLAVGLMGYVLSKIENVGFDALYNSYIFSKYNMDNTTIDSRKSNELLVKGLSNTGNELENMYLDALAPAGSVISSVEDLAKYGLAQFDNSNNDLELIRRKTFKLNNRVSLGLGWFILKAKKNIWFNHDGNTGGYSSSMFIDVENKNGVIILTNVDTEYTSNLGLRLMKSLY